MQKRIVDGDSGVGTRRGDMYLFAMAVRQVLRFAELALRVAPEDSRGLIGQAISAFEATAPDLKNIRDVLDHFDEYIMGTGRTYEAKTPEYWSENSLASVFVTTQMWAVATDGVYELHLSLAPEKYLVLDVLREAGAARTLADTVHKAFDE